MKHPGQTAVRSLDFCLSRIFWYIENIIKRSAWLHDQLHSVCLKQQVRPQLCGDMFTARVDKQANLQLVKTMLRCYHLKPVLTRCIHHAGEAWQSEVCQSVEDVVTAKSPRDTENLDVANEITLDKMKAVSDFHSIFPHVLPPKFRCIQECNVNQN